MCAGTWDSVLRRVLAVGRLAVAGCGGEPAPDGYERWAASGATFVYPEDWEEKEQPSVLIMDDEGQSLDAFMAETLTTMPVEVTPSIGPRERIEVPGAEEAIRREVTIGEGVMTVVFASRDAESHLALAVVESRHADAILDSFALD